MRRVSEEVLNFLKALKENNNREWFNEHKSEFKILEAEVKAFGRQVTALLNNHDEIERTKQFRIYRDIRFSKDKTPYKEHFGIHFQRRKPALRGGYYLHIEPGDRSFIDAGFWNPTKEDIYRVRKEWEMDAEPIETILQNATFKRYWGELHGEHLKTAPMGFDRGHPNIKLINFKQWLFQHRFADGEVLAENFAEQVNDYFEQIRPFFDYMSDLLTTDLNGVSLI